MGFNSETGDARSGKGVIATCPQHARCTKAMTAQTSASERVRATWEGHKAKARVETSADVTLPHRAPCETQPHV